MCVGCMYSRCGCVLFVVINVGIQAKCLCINTVLAYVFEHHWMLRWSFKPAHCVRTCVGAVLRCVGCEQWKEPVVSDPRVHEAGDGPCPG